MIKHVHASGGMHTTHTQTRNTLRLVCVYVSVCRPMITEVRDVLITKICCSALQCVAACCRVLQCVVVRSSVRDVCFGRLKRPMRSLYARITYICVRVCVCVCACVCACVCMCTSVCVRVCLLCTYIYVCVYTHSCTHITYTCDWDALKMGLGIF